jgi:hypothetical protein
MAVGKKLRFEVFKRDGFRCQYCGRTPPAVTLEADHIEPESKGGATDIDNLMTSCMDCNRGKGANELEAIPETLVTRAQVAQEREEQLRVYGEVMMTIRQRKEAQTNTVSQRWYQLCGPSGKDYSLGEDRRTSVRRFLEDLPISDVLDAVDIAHSKKPGWPNNDLSTWRYFCGVCWTKIKRNRGEG